MKAKIKKPWKRPAIVSSLSIKNTLGAGMMGPDAMGQLS